MDTLLATFLTEVAMKRVNRIALADFALHGLAYV
jgi:hypothetical protein